MKWTFNLGNEEIVHVRQGKNESIKHMIEEQLYILWEMRPTHKDWYESLETLGAFSANYLNDIYSKVTVDFKNHIIFVWDDPYKIYT